MQERLCMEVKQHIDFPGGSDGKASVYNAGDLGSIPGLGRSPGEGNCNPLQYSRLENPMDRGAWQATIRGVKKSGTWLSIHTHQCLPIPLYMNGLVFGTGHFKDTFSKK